MNNNFYITHAEDILKMFNKTKTDIAIEKLFGQPNFSDAFIKDNLLYIPIDNKKEFYRVIDTTTEQLKSNK